MSAPLTRNVRRALWRIPVILAEDGYSTDASLRGELGLDPGEMRTAAAILYKRRRIDRIGLWIVLPATPREPLGMSAAPGQAA